MVQGRFLDIIKIFFYKFEFITFDQQFKHRVVGQKIVVCGFYAGREHCS